MSNPGITDLTHENVHQKYNAAGDDCVLLKSFFSGVLTWVGYSNEPHIVGEILFRKMAWRSTTMHDFSMHPNAGMVVAHVLRGSKPNRKKCFADIANAVLKECLTQDMWRRDSLHGFGLASAIAQAVPEHADRKCVEMFKKVLFAPGARSYYQPAYFSKDDLVNLARKNPSLFLPEDRAFFQNARTTHERAGIRKAAEEILNALPAPLKPEGRFAAVRKGFRLFLGIKRPAPR